MFTHWQNAEGCPAFMTLHPQDGGALPELPPSSPPAPEPEPPPSSPGVSASAPEPHTQGP